MLQAFYEIYYLLEKRFLCRCWSPDQQLNLQFYLSPSNHQFFQIAPTPASHNKRLKAGISFCRISLPLFCRVTH